MSTKEAVVVVVRTSSLIETFFEGHNPSFLKINFVQCSSK